MSENIYMFDPSDEAMIQAAKKARETFKYFWRELSWEYRRIVPGLGLSIVKFAFETEDTSENVPSHEFMWLTDIEFDGVNIKGTLMNQPNWIHSIQPGVQVVKKWDLLCDWMYTMNGEAYGGYSVNVMRATMPPEERQEHDNAWGIAFGDPKETKIAPYLDEISSSLQASGPGEAPPMLSANPNDNSEHPMSENTAENVRNSLSENPSLLNELDLEGWTLIQREALAGNSLPVKIFLELGADPKALNPNGH